MAYLFAEKKWFFELDWWEITILSIENDPQHN